jgi:hypothetical protein
VKIRQHRGAYDESMATVREVKDREEMIAVIRESLRPYGFEVAPEQVHVRAYTHDVRNGWDTRIITVDGYGVWGYANEEAT